MQLSRSSLDGQFGPLIVCAALTVFPAVLLSRPDLGNSCFAVLLLWGLWVIARGGSRGLRDAAQWLRAEWPMVIAMAGFPLALAFHQLAGLHEIPGIPYLYLRFALFALIAWGLLQLEPERLKMLQWGFVAGAIVSAIWIHTAAAPGRPGHVGLFNVIPFANLSLLMGIFALISLGWSHERAWPGIVLKLLAGAAGLYTSYISETRGSWIAIPLLALIVVGASTRLGRRAKAALLVAGTGSLTLFAWSSDRIGHRIAEAIHGLTLFTLDSPDSSAGTRLQLWDAAIAMFRAHPLVGVGPEHYPDALHALAARDLITPAAAMLPHSHSDILHAMATLGIPGLAAILALYFVPAWYFLARFRIDDRDIRTASAIGIANCVGFLAFGLTETMFAISLTNAFYTVVVSACFAFVAGRQRALAQQALQIRQVRC